MEMSLYIFSILKHNIDVVLSWGFHNPDFVENGLLFDVQGFNHTGKVEILYDEGSDLFSVRILNPDGFLKEEKEGIYIDELVECIDRLVEWCPNYEECVRGIYNL